MILIDTHIFIWWIQGDSRLSESYKNLLKENEKTGIAVSIISFWEISKLIEKNRLSLPLPLDNWCKTSLEYPGIKLVNLDLDIIFTSHNLQNFHKDPADQLIAATSICKNIPLLTFDKKLIEYKDLNIVKV